MIEATEKKLDGETGKKKLIDELMAVERPGMENLIKAMEEGGFFTAPSSGAHHMAKEGGLLEHTLNVLEYARKINAAWGNPVDDKAVVVSALLHDLGKQGDHGKPNYTENILKGGSRSAAKPYVTNPNLTYFPHEVRSVMIAERYIQLSEEEETAILWHNGMYGDFKYEIKDKETPLYMIIHFADMWCSRVVEIEKDGETDGKDS